MSGSIHIEEIPGHPSVVDVLCVFRDEAYIMLLDSATPSRIRDSRYSFLTADPMDVCMDQSNNAYS